MIAKLRLSMRTISGLCSQRDVSKHASKYTLMQRINSVPVQDPQESQGIKNRCLADCAAFVCGSHFKFKPRPSGHFHLRVQAQPTAWFVQLDTPKI